ncbi:MAG: hypothetical protein ACYDAI_06305 [Trichloromonadaceae bacterium]
MKTIHLMLLAAVLVAGPAWATIKNSPHDLSSSSTSGRMKNTVVDRTCEFCHTPHYADITQAAPLWNRATQYDFNLATYYNSATLGAAAKAVNEAAIEATDAPMCMSCHDGLVGDSMVNVPTGYTSLNFSTETNYTPAMAASAQIMDGANSLKNDHPLGFAYDTAVTQDGGGLLDLATAKANGVQFFGVGANMMWCASCHDVHSFGTVAAGTRPFLIKSNTQSGLCFACHNK